MRITVPWFAIGLVVSIVGVCAQAPAPGPTFDVVSIKRHIPEPGVQGLNSTQNQRPDGGFTMTNIPAAILIGRAYATAPADMIGLPGWAMSERYNVSATSTLTLATPDDRTAMLRAMLADRFKLVVHVEPREQPVFDLVLARDDGRLGPGITKVDVDCAAQLAERAAEAARNGPPAPRPGPPDLKVPPPSCSLRSLDAMVRDKLGDGQGRLGALLEGEATMASLANFLRLSAGRQVVDKTGLPGSYRVRMNYDNRPPRLGPDTATTTDAADAIPSVFTALREQLGLKLQSSKTVRDTLIIDRFERPTEN